MSWAAGQWDAERMRADIATMDRDAALGYLRRRPGNVEAMLDALVRTPDGSPADYAAGLDALGEYGAYLVAAADALRDRPHKPRMVKVKQLWR